MAKARKVPAIVDNSTQFCPGCGHGIAVRLIAECLEELGQDQNVILGFGIGCGNLSDVIFETDRLLCPHGRAAAVCTGMKRVSPHNVIIAYHGDGDAYCIGIAETLNAAYRNVNITEIVINNNTFGMTGGQMSWTTMPNQKTATSPNGRDCAVTGAPIKLPEMVVSQFDVAYVARGTVTTPGNVNKLKGYIKKALEAQLNGEGYSLVEVLSPCPTNWGMTPLQSIDKIENEVIPYYPIGELKKRKGE